jgi:alpha-glucosidase
VHDVIEEMRSVVDEVGERVLIGEIYLPLEKLVAYYGRDLRGCYLPFNFSPLLVEWHARRIAELIDGYERLLPPGGWRTGCLAIMTARALPAASGASRRVSRRCCCSLCAAP